MRDPIIWSAIFTGVIALETLAYLIFTRRLWQATKKAAEAATASAEAAKVSADASKQAADIAAGLHRPFMGLARLVLRTDMNSRTWVIAWTIKNFGTLPAVGVDAALDWNAGMNSGAGQGPASAEVFPQDEVETLARFVLAETVQSRLATNDLILVVRPRVKYAAADGRRFLYSAEAHFRFDTGTFMVLSSQTQPA
jgi:hypothetical protein